jgi:hypothetical protein
LIMDFNTLYGLKINKRNIYICIQFVKNNHGYYDLFFTCSNVLNGKTYCSLYSTKIKKIMHTFQEVTPV